MTLPPFHGMSIFLLLTTYIPTYSNWLIPRMRGLLPDMTNGRFAYAKNNGADQLCSNCTVTAQLISAFVFATRIVQLSETSSFQPSSEAAKTDLCQAWSEIPKAGFLASQPSNQTNENAWWASYLAESLKQIERKQLCHQSLCIDIGLYVPLTTKVILRRGLHNGLYLKSQRHPRLKSRPGKIGEARGSNLQPVFDGRT